MHTDRSRILAAILLFSLVTVESGGAYLVGVVRGRAAVTEFQRSFHRAGHAHAGVFLILSLVGLLYVDAVGIDGWHGWVARSGVPLAALLLSGGFFLSSLGEDVHEPNRLVVLLLPLGGLSLAAGLIAIAVGLVQG